MRIVAAFDEGNVVDAFVNGVAGIEEIAPGVMRVSFYAEHEENNGQKEKRLVDHQLWSTVQLFEALATIHEIMGVLAGVKREKPLVSYLTAPTAH